MISSHMLDIPNVVAFLIKRFVIQYEFPSFVQTYHRSMLSTYFLGLNSSAQFILLFLFGAILNFMYLFSFGCCFKGFSLLLLFLYFSLLFSTFSLLSSCHAPASHCSGFSCPGALDPERVGLSS